MRGPLRFANQREGSALRQVREHAEQSVDGSRCAAAEDLRRKGQPSVREHANQRSAEHACARRGRVQARALLAMPSSLRHQGALLRRARTGG